VASIEEIKAGLAQGRQEASEGLVHLRAVAEQIDKAITVLQAVVGASGQPLITQAIGNLRKAQEKFAEGSQAVGVATAEIDRYVSLIG
jgi:hypothetical protein